MSQRRLPETLGIAGTGAIACGLARVAGPLGDVVVWARSERSAAAARDTVGDYARVVTDLGELADCSYLVEAVVEDPDVKRELLGRLAAAAGDDTVLASTTSSLSIEELAKESGHPERFVGLHVFNPVPRMKLVELAFPVGANGATRERARALCERLGKTPVEVPDIPGFVVNRLLFPYLFSAVDLMVQTGMEPGDVDQCMTLGAGMPMGPIALLDFVGLDVAQAIGETIGVNVPDRLKQLAADGALGRKTKRGFYRYE